MDYLISPIQMECIDVVNDTKGYPNRFSVLGALAYELGIPVDSETTYLSEEILPFQIQDELLDGSVSFPVDTPEQWDDFQQKVYKFIKSKESMLCI